MKNLICPISTEKIPEHLPRIIAFFNISIMVSYIITGLHWIIALLVIDFLLRGYDYSKYSPIFHLSMFASKVVKLKSKKIDKAPKLFASRLGGFMMLIALPFSLLGFETVAFSIIGIVIALSTLECVLSFCVGCVIYTFLVRPLQ